MEGGGLGALGTPEKVVSERSFKSERWVGSYF